MEILTGGRGNIEFPVTSVNGQTGDVMLSKRNLNLDKINNTADVDKPLSVPQKSAIMEILASYDFNVNLQDLYDHMADHNNPHEVSLDDINKNSAVEMLIQDLINKHNVSTNYQAHVDIRNRLSTLWTLVDRINNSLEDRLHNILKSLEDHISDENPHSEMFDLKEDVSNKMTSFDNNKNVNHTKYPTARAVADYVVNYITEFRETLSSVAVGESNWIDDIESVDNRADLPAPSVKYYRKAYFIRNGIGSTSEVAICRKVTDSRYEWDFNDLGSYSKFNSTHFIDTPDGIDLNVKYITTEILDDNTGILQEIIANRYYNKDEIDNMHFVDNIKILPGTQNGTIRYYINDDMRTMTDDIYIPGLKRLAYLEWVTEDELKDNAVRSKHIIDNAIEERHLQDRTVSLSKFNCGTYGTILGNTTHSDRKEIHEIKLMELADYLRPLIGGWPDPDTPGGNPWYNSMMEYIPHPHLMVPNEEHPLSDRSYIIRFTGTVSRIPNMRASTKLSDKLTVGPYRLIEAGGSWCYQSDPEEWTMLGGSNITGHTFATITMTQEGTFFESISIGDRLNASYDVWVRYFKTDEMKEGEYQPI